MSQPVGFGVIGANSFVANAAVLPAIEAAPNAHLVATASRSGEVPERWNHTDVGTYEAVLAHCDVEAVYIPLPNGMHREWTEKAAAAGKHVLCEKPLAPDVETAQAMADACDAAGVLLAEAWMTPFDRRWAATLDLLRSGAIGDVESQYHAFTFTIGPEAADNYRWDPAQGGGALLDVGIYTLGTMVELWGTDCTIDKVRRTVSPSGVDAETVAWIEWPGDRFGEIVCSFIADDRQTAKFHGTDAFLGLENAAFTSGHDLDHVIVRHGQLSELPPIDLVEHAPPRPLRPAPDASNAEPSVTEQFSVAPGDPYQTMIEAFADAVRAVREWPRPVKRSIDLLELIERIAAHA